MKKTKSNLKYAKLASLFIISCLITISASYPTADAFTMSNNGISVQGQVSIPSYNDVYGNKNNTKTPNSQSEASYSQTFEPSGQYLPITISLSSDLVDFGALSSTNPVTRTTNVTINGQNKSYQVFSFEDSPLKSKANILIPDTSCDNGSCDDQTAASWTNDLTYGFGFRCDNIVGNACTSEFYPGYYKQFPDILNRQDPSLILQSQGSQTSQITYKVNISGTQQQISYSNNITFFLIPSY